MALTISCPIDAQIMLRDLLNTHPPHSVESLTREFLAASKLTEQRVRELAYTKRTTISAIVRGLMCHKYPQLKPVWPLSKHTPAQIEGIAKRSRSPDGAELKRALELLQKLLSDLNDRRAHNAARVFLAKHGITAPDWREEFYRKPTTPGDGE